MYIFWKFIQWDRIKTLDKFALDKINVRKNALFFLSLAATHHSFIFNCQFLLKLKHKVRLSKSVGSIFDFVFSFVFIKVFFYQKTWARKATHTLATGPLIVKLQRQVLKFNDNCVRWSLLKTDLEKNFLNLKNWSFEKVSFTQ